MAKRLLIVNRRLAIAPGGRRVVLFDPATGKGAECCCGGASGPCANVCGSVANEIGRCPGGTVCATDTTTGTPVEATRWRFDFAGSGSDIGPLGTSSWNTAGNVEVGWVEEAGGCFFRVIAATGTATYKPAGGVLVTVPLDVAYWSTAPFDSRLLLNQFRLRDFAGAVGASNVSAYQSFFGPPSPCNLTYTEGTAPDQVRWTRTYASTCAGGAMTANYTTIPVASSRGSITFTCGITLLENCLAPVRTCDEWRSLWLAGDPQADLNGDGYVDAIDLDEIVRRYCV